MNDISEIFEYSKNKTRVLIFTSISTTTSLLKEILNFNEKEFDFLSDNKIQNNIESDFVIYETFNVNKASDFHPNIALITDEVTSENIDFLLKSIVSGGVLIYPESLESTIENSENYFRKLFFSKSEFQKNGDDFLLNTDIGLVPIEAKSEKILNNIEGIKLLSQQFGILEEEFYEPLMNFSPL